MYNYTPWTRPFLKMIFHVAWHQMVHDNYILILIQMSFAKELVNMNFWCQNEVKVPTLTFVPDINF